MDTLWKIAGRNVVRHKKRTIITGVVMMVGIGLYIAYDSVLSGMDRLTIDTMVAYSSSWLKVRTPEYAADQMGTPLDHGIADPQGTMAAMRQAVPGIVALAPRTLFVAQASNYIDAEPVMAVAVDPLADPKVFAVAGDVHEGAWLGAAAGGGGAAGAPAREVVLSKTIASDLGLKVGDGILLSARTIYENDNADEFRVAGIIDGSAGLAGTGSVYMSYADARAFLGETLPVTEIDAAGPSAPSLDAELASSAAAAALFKAALPALQADPVGEFARDYLAMRQAKSKGSLMLVVMILLIAAVGIVNTILMSVYSRVREIGVLRAYGMTAKDIRKLFTREGLILGTVGSLAGLALGALIDWYFTAKGLNIGKAFGNLDFGAIPVNATLYGEWRPASFVVGLVFGIGVAWLAARIPAKRAARMEPTDALRFV
jgi:putative ABC transport system permease protein